MFLEDFFVVSNDADVSTHDRASPYIDTILPLLAMLGVMVPARVRLTVVLKSVPWTARTLQILLPFYFISDIHLEVLEIIAFVMGRIAEGVLHNENR